MRAVSLAMCLLVVLAWNVTGQRTLHVPGQYHTIQDAVNAAQNHDTVLVAPGTYREFMFKGKAIAVKSAGGPAVTKVRAPSGIDVVVFQNNETRASVLDGFDIESSGDPQKHGTGIYCRASPTLRNNVLSGWRGIWVYGSPLIEKNIVQNCSIWTAALNAHGAGIHVAGGAPEIVSNLITGNVTTGLEFQGYAWSAGAGIYVGGGNARIIGNVITHNTAEAESSGFLNYGQFDATGGGICASNAVSSVLLANNVIAGNEARTILKSGPLGKEKHTSEGGGIYGGKDLINNTIFGNKATVGYGTDARGGGIHGAVRCTNCIVWDNRAVSNPEISSTTTVEHCNVKGGHPGVCNLNTDPRFVDAGRDDFHLRFDSGCRDKGKNAVSGLPKTDREGDPRIADGTADMGADEFFPHLYHTGTPAPGNTIQVKLIGKPMDVAFWAFSGGTLTTPASLPGLQGLFHLDPGTLTIIPVRPFPSTGLIGFPVAFPSTFPRISIPTQALMGTQLSNLNVVDVR